MEVILVESVKYLGKMGDIVTVKPGYARNYLVPQKKALRATETNKKLFEVQRAEIEANSAARLEKSNSVHAIIDKNFVTIIRQAGEDGKLFGSISPRDIADEIKLVYNQAVPHNVVILEKPVKYVGVHEVTVALHPELSTTMFVNVARIESEAEEAKKEFLAPPVKKAEKEE